MFNKQKAQFCQIHKSQICIGFCVSKNCPSNPFYCQKCLEQDHEDHKESCKEFGQITKDFTDLIKAKKSHLDKVKEKQIQLQQLGRYQVDAYERQIDELRNIQRNFSKKKHSSLSNQQIKIFKEQYCIDRQLDDCKFQQGLVNELLTTKKDFQINLNGTINLIFRINKGGLLKKQKIQIKREYNKLPFYRRLLVRLNYYHYDFVLFFSAFGVYNTLDVL